MTLEQRIARLCDYPTQMSQKQLGEALQISESTVHKLVRSGVIPYRHVRNGLCHYNMIDRMDAIAYLQKKYSHSSQEYIDAGRRCISLMLWDEPELLSMRDLIRITGLWQSAIQKWISKGKMHGFYYLHQTMALKRDLVDFMASPAYQDSSHANIRARAITMTVEWYERVSRLAREGKSND